MIQSKIGEWECISCTEHWSDCECISYRDNDKDKPRPCFHCNKLKGDTQIQAQYGRALHIILQKHKDHMLMNQYRHGHNWLVCVDCKTKALVKTFENNDNRPFIVLDESITKLAVKLIIIDQKQGSL